MEFIVIKFGGTSVATKERWETIGRIASKHIQNGFKPVIVCSAVTGISNLLEQIIRTISLSEDFRPLFNSLKKVHFDLAASMSLDGPTILQSDLALLEKILVGSSLINEITPRTHAYIMSFGELLSTRLGAQFLPNTQWIDAREHIISESHSYLNATCSFSYDPNLVTYFSSFPGSIITQGFIAKNHEGHTVILGRGGSDTSAAYFAAKLGARRCEIWTDVPGMYTANPRQVKDAQLIKKLDYDEAQEIATMGAKVLHPRCIAPVKQANIPLSIHSTLAPNDGGTLIDGEIDSTYACVKSISSKSNITLFSVENLGMWQEIGFLADLFSIFKTHAISIDLISTSETNVTVSVDPSTNILQDAALTSLVKDLSQLGKVQVIPACTAISLVGRNIRSILHKLGPMFDVFNHKKVYLLSQAASDLNLTFVVQEKDALEIIQDFHQLLFPSVSSDINLQNQWWYNKQENLLDLAANQSPLYVYDKDTLAQTASDLQSISSVDRLFYAIKANDHEDILTFLFHQNVGFECLSIGELERIFTLFPSINPNRILFTPNFAPKSEYAYALEHNCHVTLDSLFPLENWPELFANHKIFLRFDPGEGKGHHAHVETAGKQSKFGISATEVDRVVQLTQQHHINVVGLHAHAGSGINDPYHWATVAQFLIQLANTHFKDVSIIDLGGGLGLELDLTIIHESLETIKNENPSYQFWMEPGRYWVARAGVLLARVTQIKEKEGVHFIGLDVGMNSLIRPMLYAAHHPIVNLSRLNEPSEMTAHVVGPICESGDILGYNRTLPKSREGDVFLIANAGAYGHVMSSHYNRRDPAHEHVL